jgi:P-type conjugative transfer protein TrbL
MEVSLATKRTAGTTPAFEATAAAWSSKIFYSIVILDLLWTLYECIRTNTLEQLIDTLMYRVVGYALGVYLITNQVAITNAVFDAVSQIGAAFALPGATKPPTPNQIVSFGWDAAGKLGSLVPPQSDFGSAIVTGIALFVCSLVLQFAFLVVAVEDLVIQIGVQFCVAIGSVLLGLVATRWTRSIASLWPKMIVSTFLLTMVIGAVAGLGNQLSNQIISSVVNGQTSGGALQNFAVVTAVSLVYLLLSIFLSGLAAFMGAQTPLSVGGTIVNAVTNGFAYITGYNAGSHGGAATASGSAGGRDPVATIEAATTTSS